MTRISIQVPTVRRVAIGTSLVGSSTFSAVRILACLDCSCERLRSEEVRDNRCDGGMLTSVAIEVPTPCIVASSACQIRGFTEEAVRILAGDHSSERSVGSFGTGDQWSERRTLTDNSVQVPAVGGIATSASDVASLAQ